MKANDHYKYHKIQKNSDIFIINQLPITLL